MWPLASQGSHADWRSRYVWGEFFYLVGFGLGVFFGCTRSELQLVGTSIFIVPCGILSCRIFSLKKGLFLKKERKKERKILVPPGRNSLGTVPRGESDWDSTPVKR